MSKLVIETAEVFEPLLTPRRYKGAFGGRGSGKSRFFAELLVDDHVRLPGLRSVCIREVQKDLKDSAKRLIEDKIKALGVGSKFDCQRSEIRTPGGGLIVFQGMQDHTAESIKSLEGFGRAWIEEAQTLSERSWRMLYPTIRTDDSEIWASWNPRLRTDIIDKFFRQGSVDPDVIAVRANWIDNPWFPVVMDMDRLRDKRDNPMDYAHVWEGDYATVHKGAYYASLLNDAAQGRICRVPLEPAMTVRTFHDLGGASQKADAYAMWVAQFVGKEIRVLDYYEAKGQAPDFHINWLKEWCFKRKLKRVQVVLPHDGAQMQINHTWQGYWDAASSPELQFDTVVIPNQGKGADLKRVHSSKSLFHKIWFDAEPTEVGRLTLGHYHEIWDEKRNVGLGPDHDWSSHCADAFGLMCMQYEAPLVKSGKGKNLQEAGSWMGRS